ncbi:hypothetical protein [uncultured Methanoregula sp.]|uniref:hypothetical protein n=1 Tax=uncultured Methanoregula sp. TaxID=1005933 RepID=UPI002AAB7A8C|nr:hypothetical protein [uncultured Methanoregula sp.]
MKVLSVIVNRSFGDVPSGFRFPIIPLPPGESAYLEKSGYPSPWKKRTPLDRQQH